MKRLIITALLGLTSFAAQAQSPEAPAMAATCFTCHGPNGAKPIAPNYPILAGQYANYIEQALHEYRDGARKNPIMQPQAAALTDNDIKALGEFFSLQESTLYTPTELGALQTKSAAP